MTTLRSAINTLLNADDTLMATATGGIHEQTEISRSNTPSAYDDRGDLKPCMVLRMGTMTPFGPFAYAERQFFALWFYEKPGGYDNIDAMKYRVKTLLHSAEDDPKRVTIAPGVVHSIYHADDFGDSWDDALNCPMSYSRYYTVQMMGTMWTVGSSEVDGRDGIGG